MLSSVMYWASQVRKARAFIEDRRPRTASEAQAMIAAIVNPAELEKFLGELEHQARQWRIEPRDSIVYTVIELIDAYNALIERAEKLVCQRVDVPRGVLDLLAYWKEESHPLKLYIPGSCARA